MYSLYKITNTQNNKCYVGWTGHTSLDRWHQHKTDALRHRDNRKFYNAIRKHGVDCWAVETLMEVATAEQAKLKEIELIAKFDSYHTGYNATKGGDGNNGIIMSEESNQARRRALLGKPKNYDRMKGKRHSEETKSKISAAHRGMKKPWLKPTPESIAKSAMTRRALSKDQYDLLHELRASGMLIKDVANQIGVSSHVAKKWLKKDWSLSC